MNHQQQNRYNTRIYRQNWKKSFFMPVIIALFILILSTVIKSYEFNIISVLILLVTYIQVRSNTYFIKNKSIQLESKFLSTKNTEFFNKQITSVIFKESLIDKIFGTISITFGSIDSYSKIVFKSIQNNNNLQKNICETIGIQIENNNKNVLQEIKPKFSLSHLIASHIFFTIFIILLISITSFFISSTLSDSTSFAVAYFKIVTIGFFIIISVFSLFSYIYTYFFYKNANISIYKKFISLKKGVIIDTVSYILYKNIKDIKTTQYPFTTSGNIIINILGENERPSAMVEYFTWGFRGIKTEQILTPQSHEFSLKFISEIQNLQKSIDFKSCTQKNNSNTIIMQPQIRNNLLIPITLLIPLFSILYYLGETQASISLSIICFIIFTITSIRTLYTSYEIHETKIIKKSGIIYKTQKSITFTKINSIHTSQELINKICNNANIMIQTRGSSNIEINIKNITNSVFFYNTLQNRTQELVKIS